MNAMKTRWCRRKDLREFRGLSDQNRTGFLLVLEWFENFRLRHEREAGREAARIFWKNDVLSEDRQREPWQLEQWEAAIQWYLIRRLRPPAHPSRARRLRSCPKHLHSFGVFELAGGLRGRQGGSPESGRAPPRGGEFGRIKAGARKADEAELRSLAGALWEIRRQ